MPASIPASMVNQMYADLGIPNRFNLISSRFSAEMTGPRRPNHSRPAPDRPSDRDRTTTALDPAASQFDCGMSPCAASQLREITLRPSAVSPPCGWPATRSPKGAGWRRERDSNPRYGFPYTHFPGVRLQPLGHLSSAERHRLIRRVAFAKRLSGPGAGFPQVSGDIYELEASRRAPPRHGPAAERAQI